MFRHYFRALANDRRGACPLTVVLFFPKSDNFVSCCPLQTSRRSHPQGNRLKCSFFLQAFEIYFLAADIMSSSMCLARYLFLYSATKARRRVSAIMRSLKF